MIKTGGRVFGGLGYVLGGSLGLVTKQYMEVANRHRSFPGGVFPRSWPITHLVCFALMDDG